MSRDLWGEASIPTAGESNNQSRQSVPAAPAYHHHCPAFYDSLEEGVSPPDNLTCARSDSPTRFSDILHSDSSSTLDSDSGSFYSVQSYHTTRSADSLVSLVNSDSHSETTLYDSAQSLLTLLPPSATIPVPQQDNSAKESGRPHIVGSFTCLPRGDSRALGVYTSCPDLSPIGISCLSPPPTCPAPTHPPHYAPACWSSHIGMSSLDEVSSHKPGDDGTTKKKGLISSFRKSRKTDRKLRQQKKATDSDGTASGTGVTSDGELDSLLDSEASAPASPALKKNEMMIGTGAGEDEDLPQVLDTHQVTHERLNGSASPKGGSKNPSPVTPQSTKVEEGQRKLDVKEEKKKEKTKFGSFLARKDKKQKADTASKSSLASNTSATTDASQASTSDSAELKTEDKPEGEQAVDGAQSSADLNNPSFRSHISTVQFVKNLTVNAEQPKYDMNGSKAVAPPAPDVKKAATPSPTSRLTTSEANSSPDKREHLYKILVIGELGTGKTSIIKRYVHQFFSQHYRATIGVDFALKVINWDNNTVIRLQLWDIAGQERFGNMTRVYYKEAVGAFVVFDVTRAQTFDAVAKWKTDLDTKVTLADGSSIPTILLANKCDQPKEGVANNPARMDDYCRERGFSGWFETSAKENINIDEASRFLVNKILSNEKQGMMMTESTDTDKFSVDGKANPTVKNGCRC